MSEELQPLVLDTAPSDQEGAKDPRIARALPHARLRAVGLVGLVALSCLAVLGAALGGHKDHGPQRSGAFLDGVGFAQAPCPANRFHFNGRCICPPPYMPKGDGDEVCVPPNGPQKMTFYMYRAQGPEDFFPLENINMANLAGLMFFLHHEVVGQGRKNDITRILRFKVTMKNTEALFNKSGGQFTPFHAFDNGNCGPHCGELYRELGAVVGCQLQYAIHYMYKPSFTSMPLCAVKPKMSGCSHIAGGTWFSLPGACPHKSNQKKDDECRRSFPSGACDDPTGAPDCTYNLEPAGELKLDDIEGIKDYKNWWLNKTQYGGWRRNGNKEYDEKTDRGVGMSFWDARGDLARCEKRMQTILRMFKEKYPDLPMELPEPPCR